MPSSLRYFLFLTLIFSSQLASAKLSNALSAETLLTYEVLFEKDDFMVLKSRLPSGEIVTLREWIRDSEDQDEEPEWDAELFADRYQLLEVFGLENQKLVAIFANESRKTALIKSKWSQGTQFELETSVIEEKRIFSIVWAFQTEEGARKSFRRYQDFVGRFDDKRSPASAKKASATEAGYCLYCDVNLFEDPVRDGFAKINKALSATCRPDPPGSVSAKQVARWVLGCVKGLAGSVVSILKMLYEISNFTVKMKFNSRYQQKVADSVGSAASTMFWHPIDTLTKIYKTVEGLVIKESVKIATCGVEYRARATCQLFGEIVSGGLIVKGIKRLLGIGQVNGLHRLAGTKYNHPTRKSVARIEARRLAQVPTTRALIATAILDQQNPHLKATPKRVVQKQFGRRSTDVVASAKTQDTSLTLRLQSSKEYLDEVKSKYPRIERISREDFVRDNSKRHIVSDEENLRYIDRMSGPRPKGSRTYVFRDADKKGSNNTYGFDHSTAITTSYVERVAQKIETLRKKYAGDIEITRYEGSNRIEIDVQPKPGRKVPANLDKEMADIFKLANAEQHLFLKTNKLVRETDNPIENFKFGAGPDAHSVDLTFRANKDFHGHLSTLSWESAPTQAHLKTIFMRGQDVHRSVKSQYTKTRIFDQKTGRIDPRIADIISKSDTPEILIEKLKPYHQFKDNQGRLLSKRDQIDKAEELMEYVDYTKVYGVEYRGIRTVLNLDNSNTASFGSDLTGQNGRNISHNTTIFDSSYEDVVAASARAEQNATLEFKGLLDTATANRAKVLKEAGYEIEYQAAGDDIEMIVRKNGRPVKEVPPSVRSQIGNCNDGLVCLRDTYKPAEVHVEVNGRSHRFTDKKAMDDITHKLEKDLRPTLRKISTEYDNRNIWIDVTPDGRLKLNVSHPPNATAQELAHFKRLERIAQAKFRALVKSTDQNFLRGFRADESH